MPDYDNTGSLGKNEKKEDAKHADVKGKATIGGVKYWVDGWKKEGNDGRPWYSLRFKRADQQTAAIEQPPQPRGGTGIPGLNRQTDDIPF